MDFEKTATKEEVRIRDYIEMFAKENDIPPSEAESLLIKSGAIDAHWGDRYIKHIETL